MYKIPANTLFMGKQLVYVPECHSTNDEVQRLMQQKGSAEGMVVITANQTAGRGQRGSVWITEPGKNLTLSIGLKPNFLTANFQFYLSMAVSLGLYDCLNRLVPGAALHIKWPNDFMVNDKKVCGILIENQLVGQRIERSVAGIGLNVNQQFFAWPHATSISLETARLYDLNEVLSRLLESIEARYLQLKANEYGNIKNMYEHKLYGLNVLREFTIDQQTKAGIIKGVTDEGKLKVLIEDELHYFAFKEISYAY